MSPRQDLHMIGRGSNSIGRRDLSKAASAAQQHSPGTIRVIHIFAPKVIKTDVANFRTLVQKLTGNTKPSKKLKSRRSKPGSVSSTPLLSHSNATHVFASCNSMEFTIPRLKSEDVSPPPLSRPPEDFRQDVQQIFSDRSPVCSSFDNTPRCLPDVSSSYFHGNRKSSSCNGLPNSPVKSCNKHQVSRPTFVDPFQSLSGYMDKLSSMPQSSSVSVIDDSRDYMFTSRFSDMDILTGLVTPEPPGQEFPMSPPFDTSPDFSFQTCHHNTLCRFPFQSPLHGGTSVSILENF